MAADDYKKRHRRAPRRLCIYLGRALHSPRLITKQFDDLSRCRLQIGQMIPDHVIDIPGSLCPNNVDHAVHAPAIQEWYGHAVQPVWSSGAHRRHR